MRILNKSRKFKDRLLAFSGNRAFTLLEVMVALAILAITLATLFGAQSRDLSLAAEAKFITNASLLARMKLAEVKSGRLAPLDAQGDFGKDFPGYNWKMQVRDAAADLPGLSSALRGRLKRIDLIISWNKEASVYKIRYYLRSEDVP
jgi:general secretion pathway protein I